MAILIKGMEMPKNGYDCPMCRDGMCMIPGKDSDGICLTFGPYEEKRPNDCPLIEVPEPHGRMIDADAVSLEDGPYEYDDWCKWALGQYQDAPTIIPASEEK